MNQLGYLPVDFANARLLGEADARSRLLTPALLLDYDQFQANIRAMQRIAEEWGVSLRPHGKAHKCPEIARHQISAGAVGICAATPGEAEVFARSGLSDILLTSTFGTRVAAERIAAIAASGTALTVVADNAKAVGLLDTALAQSNATASILIDIDTGRHRSGVTTVTAAQELAQQILQADNLTLLGIQAYAGHLSHCLDVESRSVQAEQLGELLTAMLSGLQRLLPEQPVVTGCSTGAYRQEMSLGLYTELQCGSYVFMDAEYDMVDPDGSGQPSFPTSLFVATAVTSTNYPGQVTTDGGEKRFASKLGTAPVLRRGAPAGATYRPASDEHGIITLPEGSTMPVGTMLEVQVPHCDPTVNLYDGLHVMRGETLDAIWPIAARGA